MTYQLHYYAVEVPNHKEPVFHDRYKDLVADNFPEIAAMMNDWLEIERYFSPIVFNSLTLISNRMHNILPMYT